MEKYFVISYDGESPAQIVFTKKKAIESLARYFESFDENGNYVKSYRLTYMGELPSYIDL